MGNYSPGQRVYLPGCLNIFGEGVTDGFYITGVQQAIYHHPVESGGHNVYIIHSKNTVTVHGHLDTTWLGAHKRMLRNVRSSVDDLQNVLNFLRCVENHFASRVQDPPSTKGSVQEVWQLADDGLYTFTDEDGDLFDEDGRAVETEDETADDDSDSDEEGM